MTKLDNNHYYMGNGSLISTLNDNNQNGGFGRTLDWAQTSNEYDGETAFQIESSAECKQVTIRDRKYKDNIIKIEKILYKGWNEVNWKQSDCTSLPCTLNTYFKDDGRTDYMLVNVKTKAGENNNLSAQCGTEKIDIHLKENKVSFKHPNDCKFDDVLKESWTYYQYITALCSSQIVEGYGPTYKNYGPDNTANWAELTKVVNLANDFYRTKKIADSYNSGDWYEPYTDIAKKQGFNNTPSQIVTQGLAFKYSVNIFWNKTLSEQESANFLRDKIILHKSNITVPLKRGYMAYLILNSARVSADESAIDRKLPYVNHNDKDVDLDEQIDIPKGNFEIPNTEDSNSKKNTTIKDNLQETKKKNSTVSKKGYTDNTGLSIAIMGGENNLKPEYKDKKAEEIFEEAEKQSITEPYISDSDTDPLLQLFKKYDGTSIVVITVPEKDNDGENKKLMEISPQETAIVTEQDLKNDGFIKKDEVRIIDIIKGKGE